MKKRTLMWFIPTLILGYLSWMMYFYVVGHNAHYDPNYKDWNKYDYKVENKHKAGLKSLPTKMEKVVPFANYNYPVVNKSKPHYASLATNDRNDKEKNMAMNSNVHKTNDKKVSATKVAEIVSKKDIAKADTLKTRKNSGKKNKSIPELANQLPVNEIQLNKEDKITINTVKQANYVEDVDFQNNNQLITELIKPQTIKVGAAETPVFDNESMSNTNNENYVTQNVNVLDFQQTDPTTQLYAVNLVSNDEYKASNQEIISTLAVNINNGMMRATGTGTIDDGLDTGTGAVDNTGKYNDSAGSGGSLGSLPLADGNVLMALFGLLFVSIKYIRTKIKFNN